MGKLSVLKTLFSYLKKSKLLISLIFVSGVFSVAAKILIPFFTGLIIDKLKEGNLEINGYLFAIIACLILGAIFRYIFDFLTAVLNQKIINNLRNDLFTSFEKLPYSYLDKQEKGDLLRRMTSDIESVQNGLILGGSTLYEGVLQIGFTLGMMLYVNWILALIVLGLTPVSIIVSRFISFSNSKFFKKQAKDEGQIGAITAETLENLSTIYSYNAQEFKKEEFSKRNKEAKTSNFKAYFAASWINPTTRLVNNIIYGTVCLVGAILCLKYYQGISVANSVTTIGMLSTFLTYSYQYLTPFNDVSNVMSEVIFALNSLRRVDEILSEEKVIDEGRLSINEKIGDISFNKISFGYDKEKLILKDLDFKFEQGKKYALVGKTGCGKTTLLSLLLRFYDVDSGEISINNISVKDVLISSLRSHLGMVLQENFIFSASLRENITLGENYTDQEILNALKEVDAVSIYQSLPNGLDSLISDEGDLSFGQKQLISLARIVLFNPEVIILDEATSNIDIRSELLITKSLNRIMRGRTSVIVAHRLSTIKDADQILVIKDGVVSQKGSFKELLSAEGEFKDIYNSQFA